MKENSIKLIGFLAFSLLTSPKVLSQDAVPNQADRNKQLSVLKPMNSIFVNSRINLSDSTSILPENFEGIKPNKIIDKSESLKSFFKAARLSSIGIKSTGVKVLQIGDSHIKGGFFSDELRRQMGEVLPYIDYEEFGINGATAYSFNKMMNIEKIRTVNPDLLILSFGTNESHSKRYNTQMHHKEIDDLVKAIRSVLPKVPIILTTPPGSFDRKARKVYTPNPRTSKAADLIKSYANENHLAYWDLYNITGGVHHANNNWKDANLMRPDHVHYLPQGYEIQAELFFEALIKAYNDYNIL